MGKYANLEADIYSIFASTLWKAENIKTAPMNFVSMKTGDEFIRVSIVPSGSGINLNSISGLLIIDIFISAGKGSKRLFAIADKLDAYLVGKSLSTVSNKITQFSNSAVSILGNDKDDPSLYRAAYNIPFNYFGAFK